MRAENNNQTLKLNEANRMLPTKPVDTPIDRDNALTLTDTNKISPSTEAKLKREATQTSIHYSPTSEVLEDESTIQSIQPITFDSELLKKTLTGYIIGKTLLKVKSKENEFVEAKIVRTPEHNNRFFLVVDGKEVGSAVLKLSPPSSIDFAYGKNKDFPSPFPFPGAVYCQAIESSTEETGLSGIGTALHDTAVLLSQASGYEGRVYLEAAHCSDGFHYQYGFTPCDGEEIPNIIRISEEIRKLISSGEIKSSREYITYKGDDNLKTRIVPMYLSAPQTKLEEIASRGRTLLFDIDKRLVLPEERILEQTPATEERQNKSKKNI